MNNTEIIARCRQSAVIEDGALDWTDNLILDEMYDQLTQLYAASVVKSRQGYWKKEYPYQCTVGTDTYRIPPRTVSGTFERLQIRDNPADVWRDLDEVDETQAQNYEQPAGQVGRPARYVMRGDVFVLMPAPDSSYQLRCFYYLRPPRLVPGIPTAGGANMGVISTFNATTNVGVMTAPIEFWGGVTWVPLVNGSVLADIVSTDNWFEVIVPSVFVTVTGSTAFTILPTNTYGFAIELGGIIAGRTAIRYANQATSPCIPEDFHRTLADATAVRICTIRGLTEKAQALAGLVSSDLSRFGDLLTPRIRASAKVLTAPNMYRGSVSRIRARFP